MVKSTKDLEMAMESMLDSIFSIIRTLAAPCTKWKLEIGKRAEMAVFMQKLQEMRCDHPKMRMEG